MAQISIGDVTGMTQIDLSPASFLNKNQLSSLKSSASILLADLPVQLADLGQAGHPMFNDAQFAASFDKPDIPLLAYSLEVKAGVTAVLTLYSETDSPLFGGDDYDESITISPGDFWCSFEIDSLLDLTATIPVGTGGFGATVEAATQSKFVTYLEVPKKQAAIPLQQAIQNTLNAFTIPVSSQDVLAIPADRIYTTDLSGTVKLGGEWSLPLAVNQLSLAEAHLPFDASVAVQPALVLGVAGDIALRGELYIRIRRSDPTHVRLGIYKVKGEALEAAFTASAGLGANMGSTDLIESFFTALSPGIGIDKTGLSDSDLQAFQQVLNDSINRSLSIAINGAFSDALTHESAIVYEIDVSAPGEAAKGAIERALAGDWTALSRFGKLIRNVIVDTVENKAELTVNLLGLYNYASLADFVRSMRIVKDVEHGSVIITDKATAAFITVASTPLAAVPDRLRKALYESFTATAIYKALAAGAGVTSGFSATQAFLLYHDSMDYGNALTTLNAGEVLGVMPADIKTNLPAPNSAGTPRQVSHARFAASSTYSNEDVLRFFFSDINALQPRTQQDLEKIGRTVLARLLNPLDATDRQRIQALENDEIWSQLDKQGANIPAPHYSDWYDVTAVWSPAIAKVGPLLAEAVQYAKTLHGDPLLDRAFMDKRQKVLLAFNAATRGTHAAFNPSFPICVMATLAARTPGTPPPDFEASWNGKIIFSNAQPKGNAVGTRAGKR